MEHDGNDQRGWRLIAAVASVAAGGVHLGAAGLHLEEWPVAGLFMLTAGASQVAWGLWVTAGARAPIVAAGIAGNAAVASLWLASRTAGLPTGPEPGTPESVHGPDLLATLLEAIVVVAAIAVASRARIGPPPVLARATVLLAVATIAVGGDDPAREQLVAAATLALATTARAFVALAPRPSPSEWRSHVQGPLARRARRRVGVAARAGVGAR